ncbi:MAG: ArsR family transcriptional regulator [bacterium]|nr:ArsR family transcriptional regulator [bacterium]
MDLLEKKGAVTVTGIYIKLRLEQSIASQHLGILRRAGVVKTKKQDRWIYYSLNRDCLNQISEIVKGLAG